MSTPFVRQLINLFPETYLDYVQFASNVEKDIKDNLITSMNMQTTIVRSSSSFQLKLQLFNGYIQDVEIESEKYTPIKFDCNFKPNTFMDVLPVILMMIIQNNHKVLKVSKK